MWKGQRFVRESCPNLQAIDVLGRPLINEALKLKVRHFRKGILDHANQHFKLFRNPQCAIQLRGDLLSYQYVIYFHK